MSIQLLNGEKWDEQELLAKMDDDSFYYLYLGKHALSSSSIKLLQSSPKKYHYVTQYGNEESQALRDGWLFHTSILEPEVFNSQIFVDVQSKNTKKYKEALAEHGKVFTMKEKSDAERLADAFLKNEQALQLITDCDFEVPAVGTIDDLPFRGKADVLGKHGIVDLKKAIYQSCDVFFYELANKMGINNIFKSMNQFGFGRRTGIDISGEVEGLLPSKEWKKKRFDQVWYPGDTISVGIGQGYFLATPIQLAVATSIIANKGNKVVPKLLLSGGNSQINLVSNFNSDSYLSNIEYVKDSMVAVTSSEGTAYSSAQNLNFKLAGKTGTAQVFSLRGRDYDEDKIQEKLKDHSLFVAFAPANTPKIAIALIIENGGSGSAVAAPMASKILEYFLKKN